MKESLQNKHDLIDFDNTSTLSFGINDKNLKSESLV